MQELNMNNKKNKRRKIKIKINKKIIILLIVLCIILLIIFPILLHKYRRHKMLKLGQYRQTKELKDPKEDGILNLSGAGVFWNKMPGDMNSSEVAFELEDFALKKLPRTYNYIKDYNTNELYTFYQKNQKSIYNMYGIDNSDDFIKFGKNIQIKRDNLNDCYRLDILSDSFKEESDRKGYMCVEFETKYKDESKISFLIYVGKSEDVTPFYIITSK